MTLKEYARLASLQPCIACGGKLPARLNRHENENGWEVEGFARRLWLSVICPNAKCDYENSLADLQILAGKVHQEPIM
jgi:hypothetical protein